MPRNIDVAPTVSELEAIAHQLRVLRYPSDERSYAPVQIQGRLTALLKLVDALDNAGILDAVIEGIEEAIDERNRKGEA